METTYRLTLAKRILNRLVKVWVRLGLPPQKYHLLTVPGRHSGHLHSTPVSVMRMDGQRWLVCPYGERAWVKNARAAGQVVLSRGFHSETVIVVEELGPDQSAPVLQKYMRAEPITRRFFKAAVGSPLPEFAAEAGLHPVFRIIGPGD